MSPIETAKALASPRFRNPDSNADAGKPLKEVGGADGAVWRYDSIGGGVSFGGQ